MKRELVFKILKIFICALLSVVFVFGLCLTIFYYSITALTKPETVAMVIQEVNYKEVVTRNPNLKRSLGKYGITPSEADTVMKSKETGELIEVYADKINQIFSDVSEDKKMDASYLRQIVHDNTDEFIEFAEKNTNLKIEKSQAKKTVDDFFENNEVVIEESIEVIKEVKDVVKTINATRVVENKLSFLVVLVVVAVVFAIIAIIILLMRSNGFLWVGIDFGIISIILGLVVAFSKSGFISGFALQISDFGTQIIESAVLVGTEKIIIVLFGTVIMTVLFISFFGLLKFLKKKYQTAVPVITDEQIKED